jgi:hypothetical protein
MVAPLKATTIEGAPRTSELLTTFPPSFSAYQTAADLGSLLRKKHPLLKFQRSLKGKKFSAAPFSSQKVLIRSRPGVKNGVERTDRKQIYDHKLNPGME